MIRRILFLTSMLVLVGCASVDTADVFSPYLEETFKSWRGTGPASLSGHAFYKLPSGRVISCAGSMVTLLPANGYNVEAEQSIGMGKGFPENYNRGAMKFAHKTICDGAGRFAFEKLPAQNWILLVHLTWQEPDPVMFWRLQDKGGYLMQEVMLEGGPSKTVLSNQEFVADDSGSIFPF